MRFWIAPSPTARALIKLKAFAKPRQLLTFRLRSAPLAVADDAAFNNFQIFNPDGKVLMFVGSYGGNPGQFNVHGH